MYQTTQHLVEVNPPACNMCRDASYAPSGLGVLVSVPADA